MSRKVAMEGAGDVNVSEVLIHTFATRSYLGWAELFLEALRFQHGERFRVRLDGRDLTDGDIDLLHRVYGNLEVRSEVTDYQSAADELGVDLETFHSWRKVVERGVTNDKNYPFKIFVSVNQRYRQLDTVLHEAKQAGYRLVLHSDADVYFRTPLNRLLEIMSSHDIALYTRKRDHHRLKVWGGLLGFNLNDASEEFVRRWMEEIDAVPYPERWMGFGQSAIWLALQRCSGLRLADLSVVPEAPKFSKTFEREKDLWLGNSKVPGPIKVVSIGKCWEDLLSRYPRIPLPRRTAADHRGVIVKGLKQRVAALLRW